MTMITDSMMYVNAWYFKEFTDFNNGKVYFAGLAYNFDGTAFTGTNGFFMTAIEDSSTCLEYSTPTPFTMTEIPTYNTAYYTQVMS